VLDSNPNLAHLGFMESTNDLKFKHDATIVTRCGYTGEDGFEVSLPNSQAEAFMDAVFAVKDGEGAAMAVPVGLGARDSLRLEAGLCLYGHELNEDISPIQAMLAWTISKRRKESLGFLGEEVVKKHMDEGINNKRCGFVGGKIPVRENTELFEALPDGTPGKKVGIVTSGTIGPSIKKACGMAYVDTPFNKFKTNLIAVVRGKNEPVTVTKMPFYPSNYYKKP
jgi:aminomethyltransferase